MHSPLAKVEARAQTSRATPTQFSKQVIALARSLTRARPTIRRVSLDTLLVTALLTLRIAVMIYD